MRYIKTFENMALAKSIISKKMEAFDKLKELLKSNLGYIGKFTEYLMNENIPYVELENLYQNLIDLKKKQKPIDISDLSYEGVVDKIQKYKNDILVNSLISQFPSEQKKIARDLANNITGYNLLLKASNNHKIDILITKISRYHSKEELKSALTLFSKESINDKEKIKEYIKESKSEIVYDKDDIMIVKVISISDIQKLGSDTSWCILGQSMWNRYTSGRYQYILYDFSKDDWDPKFKIGFTLNKDFTVHAAHDILDSGCSSYLNDIMNSNDIKYSQLVPKSEVINLTNDMISNLKKSSTISILRQYSDSASLEQIPIFLNKLFDISTKDDDISLGESKIDIFKNCLNRYFSDKVYVTFGDLKAVDSRLPSMIRKLQSKNPEILKRKLVSDKPVFNERELNSSISVSMLDIWKKEDLVKSFGSDLTKLIKIPGASLLYSGEEFKFTNDWSKEKIESISNKINEIYKDGIWKKSFESGNKYQFYVFIKNYVIFNYALGRGSSVDKSAINLLKEDYKIEYAYLLKMPIDLSKCEYIIRTLNKWSIPLIIKKDYDDKFIYIESMKIIIPLVNHLLGYKLKFKLSKTNFNNYTRFPMKLESEGSKIMHDLISKFKVKKGVGDKVETEDGKITIELF
jgi:hypothetical protein